MNSNRSENAAVTPDNVSRRKFCNRLLTTSAAVLVVANCKSPASAAPFPGAYPAVRIEGAEAMRPNSFLLFNYPNRSDPAILVRTSDGKYYAHGQKCSHLGCSINFNREQNFLQCPCHNGAYDMRSGFVLHGPPRRPLDRIFLEMRGGELWAVGRTNDCDAFVNTAT
ncbi:MAG TPA: Rieske 2Fe-2S domain-containing protein [Pyrinomonadaceae bacterium]|nr:Rieske 2Fe-2S domain-containing protein [Pyrinomonadaceae bacterium]